MSKEKLLFEDVKDYKEFKNIILNNCQDIIMLDCDILNNGLLALNKKDELLNNKILNFSFYIDKKLNTSTNNKFRKIPNIIVGSFLLNKYDLDYSSEELSILSNHLISYSYNEIDSLVSFYKKDLIEAISLKTKNYEYQEELMNLASYKETSDIVNYIKTGNLEELVVESHKLQRDVADNFRL